MLKNILNSWSALNPNECHLIEISDATYCIDDEFCIDTEEIDLEGEIFLQGYIQRSVIERGWHLSLDMGALEYGVTIETDDDIFTGLSAAGIINPLTFAYVEALASFRAIGPDSIWRHFKPTTPLCHVIECAAWGEEEKINKSLGKFNLEEEPEIAIELGYTTEGELIYSADEDCYDRVFYHYGGEQRWARTAIDFRSLVRGRGETLGDTGMLRFIKLPPASYAEQGDFNSQPKDNSGLLDFPKPQKS